MGDPGAHSEVGPAHPSTHTSATSQNSLRICFLISLEGSSQFWKRIKDSSFRRKMGEGRVGLGEMTTRKWPAQTLMGNTVAEIDLLGTRE